MNIIIKDVEGKQRIKRLIDYLDLNFYDWSEQPNDGKPIVSRLLPCPFCGLLPYQGRTEDERYTAKCSNCGLVMLHDRKDKLEFHWNARR